MHVYRDHFGLAVAKLMLKHLGYNTLEQYIRKFVDSCYVCQQFRETLTEQYQVVRDALSLSPKPSLRD